ncbi:KOW domain-containing RNA-binding protein [Alicyclobacillus kakegawensis]|uniref:KOW domain-containing RNA-binding protein n=1 Tax=Alicyclobacillus kakegawensis TaxID=392012 RepID=UPI000834C952|nr:KOW domain-containing RNA-binding protein [Alicyclobacillus kakegawensis]
MRQPELPEIGRIVEVAKGRDSGLFAIVIGHVGDRFVLISDGRMRKADKPKKKNVLHLRRTPYVAEEVRTAMLNQGRVTNAQLRHALRVALPELLTMHGDEEGGAADGEG